MKITDLKGNVLWPQMTLTSVATPLVNRWSEPSSKVREAPSIMISTPKAKVPPPPPIAHPLPIPIEKAPPLTANMGPPPPLAKVMPESLAAQRRAQPSQKRAKPSVSGETMPSPVPKVETQAVVDLTQNWAPPPNYTHAEMRRDVDRLSDAPPPPPPKVPKTLYGKAVFIPKMPEFPKEVNLRYDPVLNKPLYRVELTAAPKPSTQNTSLGEGDIGLSQSIGKFGKSSAPVQLGLLQSPPTETYFPSQGGTPTEVRDQGVSDHDIQVVAEAVGRAVITQPVSTLDDSLGSGAEQPDGAWKNYSPWSEAFLKWQDSG